MQSKAQSYETNVLYTQMLWFMVYAILLKIKWSNNQSNGVCCHHLTLMLLAIKQHSTAVVLTNHLLGHTDIRGTMCQTPFTICPVLRFRTIYTTTRHKATMHKPTIVDSKTEFGQPIVGIVVRSPARQCLTTRYPVSSSNTSQVKFPVSDGNISTAIRVWNVSSSFGRVSNTLRPSSVLRTRPFLMSLIACVFVGNPEATQINVRVVPFVFRVNMYTSGTVTLSLSSRLLYPTNVVNHLIHSPRK